jgi:hypothetical protein
MFPAVPLATHHITSYSIKIMSKASKSLNPPPEFVNFIVQNQLLKIISQHYFAS